MLIGSLVDGGVLDVRILRIRALSLVALNVFGVLGILSRFLCLRLDTGFARAGILSAVLCLVTRVIGARLLSFASGVFRVCIGLGGSLSRVGVLGRLVCVLLVAGLARAVGIRSHSTRAVSSIGGRVVRQVAARTEIGKDLDVPGTGQPAEQVGIGGRVGRQRRPQVGAALCDGGLQGLVRSLSGNRRIGLMRRHHELNRIHAEPFRENVWVTSTDRARSQPILGPSPGSDHPRW